VSGLILNLEPPVPVSSLLLLLWLLRLPLALE
jgi:hypothetical protein